MKQIILTILVGLFFCVSVNAQSPNTNLNSKVEAGRKANGTVLIHTEKGKYKVYASFKKSKVDSYYAIDAAGKRVEVTYNAELTCTFCISKDGALICYEVACTNIPAPKLTATKTRI